MKKILILAMSCQNAYFQKQIDIIKKTWASDLPENTDFGYYDGGHTKNSIVTEDDGFIHISVTGFDTLEYTFLKTMQAIRPIFDKYDYIFRVNTSTWVNVKLLRKFVDEIANEGTIYASELYSLTEAACPMPLDIYARGNAIFMSTKLWKTILDNCLSLLYLKIVDDVAIGNVINTWLKMSGEDYLRHYTGLPHGWYKASHSDVDTGHALCSWGKVGDKEFYRDFMTVQTKMYREREEEIENMIEFADMMKDIDNPSLDLCKEYMQDPSVFIGSTLGYIPLSTWKKTDKRQLYMIEMGNKAIDDKENPNFSQEAYDKLHRVPNLK